jgi:hypothetical protein
MKKQFLTIATLAFGALVLITNCKKKEDSPAPATSTTTGTTTTGTTTSGTTTTGTTSGTTTTGTTSGSTTSSTTSGSTTATTTSGSTTASTTSGSTTSSTTSGSTTASTTSGTTAGSTTGTSTIGGTGTFVVNGATNTPAVMIKSSTSGITQTITQNSNYSFQLSFGNEAFTSGTYTIASYLGTATASQVKIAIVDLINGSTIYWSDASTTGTVTVSGKTVTFSGVTIKQYNGTATITVSGNYTFN